MHQYKIRHNLIYMMNEQFHFDGLLLTFPNLSRMQKDIYQGIPKVYLATDLQDEVTVNTDPNRFVHDFYRLQTTMNESLRPSSASAVNNKLFSMMKDKAIQFQGVRQRVVIGNYNAGRSRNHDFLTWTTNYGAPGEAALEYMIRQMDRIGFQNAAMFLYREPVVYTDGDPVQLPETMQLRCVIRNGELFALPADGKGCPVAEIYKREELPVEKLGYFSYPLFYGKYLFGMLVCGADGRLFEIGEFLTSQIGRSIFINWVSPAKE